MNNYVKVSVELLDRVLYLLDRFVKSRTEAEELHAILSAASKADVQEPVGEIKLSELVDGLTIPVVPVDLPIGTKLYATPQYVNDYVRDALVYQCPRCATGMEVDPTAKAYKAKPTSEDDANDSVNATNAVLASRYFELLKIVEQYEKHGVIVPVDLLIDLRDSANECYNVEAMRSYTDERRITIYAEQVRQADELLVTYRAAMEGE